MPHVGQEIRRRREEKGWSQAKLGVLSGTGPSGISQIETGRRNPSAATLQRIAEALEVEVAELFPKAQAPLPLEDGPSLEELHAKAGCATDWLLKPADEWYAAFRAKSREEAREKVLRIARQVEDEYLAVEPELFDAMRREKALHPEKVWRRGSSHALWQAAVSRYIEVWDAVRRALAKTDDPTDDSSFPPAVQLPEPDFPIADVDGGLVGKSNEELEEILEKRSQVERERKAHA
jgi:transcriptional regulator with XRE-family HTH domain